MCSKSSAASLPQISFTKSCAFVHKMNYKMRTMTCLLGFSMMCWTLFYSSIIRKLEHVIRRRKQAKSSLPMMTLHMGPRKTGTSAIQRSLLKARPCLLKDAFVYFRKTTSEQKNSKIICMNCV